MSGASLGLSADKATGKTNGTTTQTERGSGTGTASGTSESTPWSFSQPYIQGLLNRGIEVASTPSTYGPSQFVGSNPAMQQGWAYDQSAAQGIGQLANTAGGWANNMLSGGDMFAGVSRPNFSGGGGGSVTINAGNSPSSKANFQAYMDKAETMVNNMSADQKAAYDRTIHSQTENFNRNVLPGIAGGAVAMGPGALGGSRRGIAEGLAMSGLNNNLSEAGIQQGINLRGFADSQADSARVQAATDAMNRYSSDNSKAATLGAASAQAQASMANARTNAEASMYGADLNHARSLQLGALGALPNLAMVGQLPGNIYSQIGTEQRGLSQERQAEMMRQHQYQQDQPRQDLNWLQNLLGIAAPYGTNTSSGTESYTNQQAGTGWTQGTTKNSNMGMKFGVGGSGGS